MTHRPARRLAAAVLALPLAYAALPASPAQSAAPAVAHVAAPVALSATLRPSGDADGSGHAMLTLNEAGRKVCATIHWSGIADPTFAHVHKVSDGSVVVDLTGAATGGARCTRGVRRSLVRAIVARPGRYYVNVHTAPYPAGAIRGKLHPVGHTSGVHDPGCGWHACARRG
ncbi:CHRD domain-containing protein [Nocardioides sp. B-3]|uniref:CHRD domain-containing protein n=1 Tax=Nocardioides sp. B-3 TaxID=2895565 RepID=UPI002152B6C8|nr:CHRD domain-containing protein [Nocardioides sp. B-3]UUZ57902.1 CHRD domain-containing protein [Nocardioides sp. B-3]